METAHPRAQPNPEAPRAIALHPLRLRHNSAHTNPMLVMEGLFTMLITSGEYPQDWDEIAHRIKAANGWKCERCRKGHNLKEGRIMTVHHLDGDKANSRDYNLTCLCRRCHLKMHHLFSPDQIMMFPAPTWLQKHIDASPWKCTG